MEGGISSLSNLAARAQNPQASRGEIDITTPPKLRNKRLPLADVEGHSAF